MVKRCRNCSSLNVNPYANSLEKFICEDCGHIGPAVYEDDEFADAGVDEG